LDKSQDWILEAVASNVKQILLQLERAKVLVHEKLFELFLVPFPRLDDVNNWKTRVSLKRSGEEAVIINMSFYRDLYSAFISLRK
jgi:hypothetical protein